MQIITKQFLAQGQSDNGGWSVAQLRAIGFDGFDFRWKHRAIGKEISDENARLFIGLKNKHLNKKKDDSKNTFSSIKNSKKRDKIFSMEYGEMPISEQYKHPLWQKRRLEIMARDGFRCVVCAHSDSQLHVHHNTYDSYYIWNCKGRSMITICDFCHNLFHKNRRILNYSDMHKKYDKI